jgi:hypothetical protein
MVKLSIFCAGRVCDKQAEPGGAGALSVSGPAAGSGRLLGSALYLSGRPHRISHVAIPGLLTEELDVYLCTVGLLNMISVLTVHMFGFT